MGAIIGALFVSSNPTFAATGNDTVAIRAILSQYHSPLPAWTIEAFKAAHPAFDVAGYLALMQAESGMGTNCGIAVNNPGGIKGGAVGTPWRDLRSGVGKRGFNLYASMYDGNRANILLFWLRYNDYFAAHDWHAVGHWFGWGVPGVEHWLANVRAAHDRYVRIAAKLGAVW